MMIGILRNILNNRFFNSSKLSYSSVKFSNSQKLCATEDRDTSPKQDGCLNQESSTQDGSLNQETSTQNGSLNQETSTQDGSLNQETSTQDGPPTLPNTCCMSGCANCVWLDYAEEVVRFYEDRGEQMDFASLLREVDRNIDDPMIKAFITMELKSKYLFKKS